MLCEVNRAMPKRSNDRTRMIVGLELAVILPAAALVILSALHLKSIQRDKNVEAAIQLDFSHVLAISEKQINQRAYALADDVRLLFPAPGAACSGTLDRLLLQFPYIAHVFVIHPDGSVLFRSQPDRVKDAGFHDEAADLHQMFDNWAKF